jgi:hypothetical protein
MKHWKLITMSACLLVAMVCLYGVYFIQHAFKSAWFCEPTIIMCVISLMACAFSVAAIACGDLD